MSELRLSHPAYSSVGFQWRPRRACNSDELSPEPMRGWRDPMVQPKGVDP